MTLTEAIVVKISHDLAGGIGAFSNTIDLMKMDAGFQQEGLGLLEDTGKMLNARLKFFRALFGLENKTISMGLVKDYVATLASPIQLQGKIASRLQLAMVALGIELLGLGGSIAVEANAVVLEGKEIQSKPAVVQVLMGGPIQCTPENVTAAWLMHLVEESGQHLTFEARGTSLVLRVA